MSLERSVTYVEMHGPVGGTERRAASGDIVVLSNLDPSSGVSGARSGICLRFVGRGRESYRIGGRGMHVDEAQVMVAPQTMGEEFEIPRWDRGGTLGLCVLLSPEPEELPWVCGPLVASAACIPIGAVMERHAKALSRPVASKQDVASALAADLRALMPSVTRAVIGQAAAIEAAKPSTRFEMVRRAHLAQAYLHSALDRTIDLPELANAVGHSPFQLLRAFQKCFGESPAEYHRRLRLNGAVEAARRQKIPLAAAAQAFGFADGSSFSHAYRRAFGRAPVWAKSTSL